MYSKLERGRESQRVRESARERESWREREREKKKQNNNNNKTINIEKEVHRLPISCLLVDFHNHKIESLY